MVTKKRQAAKGRSSSKSRTNNIRNLHTRVMTAKGRKVSSTRWLKRQLNDPYIEAAKRDGYRSRSAYKLMQLNDRFQLLKPDMKVIDLGAAPGSWSQVIVREIGSDKSGSRAQLISLDILEMNPLPGAEFILKDFILGLRPFKWSPLFYSVILMLISSGINSHTFNNKYLLEYDANAKR